MKKLTDKQVARILALHAKGKTEREIAAIVGCSRSAVWGRIQKAKA